MFSLSLQSDFSGLSVESADVCVMKSDCKGTAMVCNSHPAGHGVSHVLLDVGGVSIDR
jgi:hypothetical protein